MLGFTIVGDIAVRSPQKFSYPPEKAEGDDYHSVQAENKGDPTVLYDGGRFYPCYIVYYK